MIERTPARTAPGFALVATLLALFLLSALAMFGVGLARQEQAASVRNSTRTAAAHAAELGLARGLTSWNLVVGTSGATGDTVLVETDTVSGGAYYEVNSIRLDDGTAANPLYALQSAGFSKDGRREDAGLLVMSVPLTLPVNSAVRVRGGVTITGNAEVSGHDVVPSAQTGVCPEPGSGLPGVLASDTSQVDVGGSADVQGDPDIAEEPDTTGFFNFGDLTFEEVAELADLELPHDTHISSTDPSPTLTENGSCDTSDPHNWGDPEDPTDVCGKRFPLIHAKGDLKLSGSGAGQGILLVEGDLDLSGGVEFYGPVIVKGMVKSTGTGFHFHGGLVSGATDINDESTISGNTGIAYSSCAVQRAIANSPATRPVTLTERAWFGRR